MPKPRSCPGKCNVLLVGGGGREHALAWKIRQSPRLGKLWLTHPGNGGLAKLGQPCSVKMDMKNTYQMTKWCDDNNIHLVVVGPEAELAQGIADTLQNENRMVFGPSKGAAQIEADKAFAKDLMRQAAIPTADARIFKNADDAKEYVVARPDTPWVVKASGLAAGKGVIVCDTVDEAVAAIDRIAVDQEFGDAGGTFLVEEKLLGQEVSVLALVDGRNIWILDPCQDHKQRDEGDRGPNTGGMGAFCPAPVLDDKTIATVEREILVPAIDALRREGIEYRGVLYAGLMLTAGGPKVLEFNCRFGDPECQPLMARFDGDLIEVLWSTAAGQLANVEFGFDSRVACCVVMCSGGYPGSYEKGKVISGIEDAEALSDDTNTVKVFHAGTTVNHNGDLVTHGGRVLGVTALAGDLRTARDLANDACSKISFDGAFHRHDIGHRILDQATANS